MPNHADPSRDEPTEDAALTPSSPRARTPMLLGGLAALAVSGGLAWWLTSPQAPFENRAAVQAMPAPEKILAAAPSADREQVRRAYEDFAAVYAASGPDGLARFRESCADSLKADPRIVDFCLAFDLFAEAVAAEPVPGKAQARRLALVQTALPGAEPNARIEEVRRLMRQVTGVPERPAGSPPVQKAVAAPAERRPPAGLSKASAREPVRTPPRRVGAAARPPALPYRCRLAATPADRLVCATPALEVQHRRMRQAYEAALAAGADPLEIDRGQAQWRVRRNGAGDRAALGALYQRRIRELSAEAAKDHPEIPPT